MAIITKHSETPGVVPTAAQLELGELAINTADSKLFAENTSGQVIELSYRDARVKDYLSSGNFNANIIPATNNTYDLGSATKMWRDVYIGPGSLYVNGQKVIQEETVTGDIIITADADQNIRLSTLGSGDIQFDPLGTGSVIIKGPLQIQTGNNISSSDGNAINFSSSIAVDNLTSKTTNADLNLTGNGTGSVRVDDNLIITGNLTVSGTTTTVNTETISLADNIIDLNSNFTTGTPSENSGIRIMRGDSAAVQLRWNETTDKWEFTNDGTTYVEIPTSGGASLTSFSVTDSGGDGSLSYNNTTGVFTYTGPSSTEVRSHLSAGTGLSYSSGQFSIDSTVVTTTGTQTLSNKTIAASSNTISGLTNTNLSGTAGITNANLANSSITINGTAVSLGGTRTINLSELGTVSISSPTNGQVLKYNGTNWVNGTDSTGGGAGTVTSVGLTAGTGISTSGGPITSSGNITVTNTGVTGITAGTGISASASTGGITLTNTGVTSLTAGSGISITASTGSITISATGGGGSVATYTYGEVLMVGGGGGGGAYTGITVTLNASGGAGGGAGGFIETVASFEIGVPYSMSIGAGGQGRNYTYNAGVPYPPAIETNGCGGDTVITLPTGQPMLIAYGGGAGANASGGGLLVQASTSGGSGGGGVRVYGTNGQFTAPFGAGQGRQSGSIYGGSGNDGGGSLGLLIAAPAPNVNFGMGGGGAGSHGMFKHGGKGRSSPITGTPVSYAGGGGGGADSNYAAGNGNDGGGAGASATYPSATSSTGTNGTANTGGGGGGGGMTASTSNGGNGGSGIIIIKIPNTRTASFTSGLTTSLSTAVAGFNIYSITAGKGAMTIS